MTSRPAFLLKPSLFRLLKPIRPTNIDLCAIFIDSNKIVRGVEVKIKLRERI